MDPAMIYEESVGNLMVKFKSLMSMIFINAIDLRIPTYLEIHLYEYIMIAELRILILLLLYYVVASTRVDAQMIHHFEGKQYIFNEVIYEYRDMGPIFQKNELAHNYFLKAEKKRKVSKALGRGALISIPAGLGLGYLAQSTADNNWDFRGAFVGYGIWSLGLISGVAAIFIGSSSKKHRKKSIELFNGTQQNIMNNEPKTNVNLIFKNGIGLQILF